MTKLSISIAMCTYNGAAFVREQLDSFARQTRLPEELIICDDRSTDTTVDIVQGFAQSAPFPVRVEVNDENLGVARNFGKATQLCTGDLIALSDQDDIWREDKLDVLVRAFEGDPALTLVFTDADLVDQDLRPMGKRLSDTGPVLDAGDRLSNEDEAFEFLMRRNVATGATMAFRAGLRGVILPIPPDLLTYHDAWIVGLAVATGKVRVLTEPLIQYRQHPGQHTWDFVYVHGAKRTLDRTYYRRHLAQLTAMRERLLTAAGLDRSESVELAYVDGYIDHLQHRLSLPTGRLARIKPVLTELVSGKYSCYSNGLRSAARDLIAGPE